VNQIPVRVTVEIKLDAPFHVGGGKGGSGTSSYLVRDGNNAPYWPGSAFKGKVRHFARLLLEGAAVGQCEFEHRVDFVDFERKQDDNDASPCKCLVCKMLGGAGNAKGSLLFGDMKLNVANTEMRTGNAIDRYRRTAKDESLFQIETADAEMLTGEIIGTLSEENYDEQKALLEAAIKAIPHIGGNTGRGLGWIAEDGIAVEIIALDAEEVSVPVDDPPWVTVPVTITAQSPLLIGKKSSESNFRATLGHIPGAVLRAALAQTLIAQDGGAEEGKVNWVAKEGGQGRFPSLRRAFGELRITQCLPEECRFAPVTVECLKGSKQGYDTLLVKREEKAPTERVKGYIDGQGRKLDGPTKMVVTKSAMNRFRGTSQDEMLFSMEVMLPPVVFQGEISGVFDPAELERLTQNGIRVGGYQTAGHGRCKMEIGAPTDSADTPEQLRRRVEMCRGKIPVTLRSDAIVALEPPEDTSNEGYLLAYQKALFSTLTGVKLTKVIAQHSQWRGFDTSKPTEDILKRQTYHVIDAGAVFLLETEAPDLTDELLAALLKLQSKGVCQDDIHNRNGYGQIRVADEFHFIREESK